VPGTMVSLSPVFAPVLIKGLKVNPTNPLAFDFILDTGDSNLSYDNPALKIESEKLIKYFFAAMTVPEKDLWVNLSPYEKDRMIDDSFGKTEMGRDLLAQDYILKQLTASLIYPEKELGKVFWDKVYAKARQRFGTSEIPVNTFNKVWIVADKADVFERNNSAYVVGAHLKVMLEEDYTALKKVGTVPTLENTHTTASEVIREVVLPEIEKEVNTGKSFAPLRQMFYSMILASWYKAALKDTLLTQVYGNKGKVGGVSADDVTEKEKIFDRYLQAYKKGVFNYIRETEVPGGQSMPRKYFSGGASFAMLSEPGVKRVNDPSIIPTPAPQKTVIINGGAEIIGKVAEKIKLDPAAKQKNQDLAKVMERFERGHNFFGRVKVKEETFNEGEAAHYRFLTERSEILNELAKHGTTFLTGEDVAVPVGQISKKVSKRSRLHVFYGYPILYIGDEAMISEIKVINKAIDQLSRLKGNSARVVMFSYWKGTPEEIFVEGLLKELKEKKYFGFEEVSEKQIDQQYYLKSISISAANVFKALAWLKEIQSEMLDPIVSPDAQKLIPKESMNDVLDAVELYETIKRYLKFPYVTKRINRLAARILDKPSVARVLYDLNNGGNTFDFIDGRFVLADQAMRVTRRNFVESLAIGLLFTGVVVAFKQEEKAELMKLEVLGQKTTGGAISLKTYEDRQVVTMFVKPSPSRQLVEKEIYSVLELNEAEKIQLAERMKKDGWVSTLYQQPGMGVHINTYTTKDAEQQQTYIEVGKRVFKVLKTVDKAMRSEIENLKTEIYASQGYYNFMDWVNDAIKNSLEGKEDLAKEYLDEALEGLPIEFADPIREFLTPYIQGERPVKNLHKNEEFEAVLSSLRLNMVIATAGVQIASLKVGDVVLPIVQRQADNKIIEEFGGPVIRISEDSVTILTNAQGEVTYHPARHDQRGLKLVTVVKLPGLMERIPSKAMTAEEIIQRIGASSGDRYKELVSQMTFQSESLASNEEILGMFVKGRLKNPVVFVESEVNPESMALRQINPKLTEEKILKQFLDKKPAHVMVGLRVKGELRYWWLMGEEQSILFEAADGAMAPGGIDLDSAKMEMNVSKDSGGVSMQFDPALADRIKREGFDGLKFNIYSILPVSDLKALLFS
jgi:hypothetical protein